MSVILDALRRRSTDRSEHADAGGSERTASGDAVLATLGYPKPSSSIRGRLATRTLVLGGVAAVASGFVAMTLLIFSLSPSSPPPRRAPVQARASNAPPRPAVPPPAIAAQPVAPPLAEAPHA